jgi:hypothetical protein
VLRDDAGRPALSRQVIGRGAVYSRAYPLEPCVGEQALAKDASHRLYELLAGEAPLPRDHPSSDPRVQTHVVRAADAALIWAQNRSWDEVRARIDAPGAEPPFAAKETRVLRVTRR